MCVFCGSSAGRVRHMEIAAEVGRALAEREIEVVYGGGRIGTMGAVADTSSRRSTTWSLKVSRKRPIARWFWLTTISTGC
jgi:predicted Rossmann-fold nucleotide-binding protein